MHKEQRSQFYILDIHVSTVKRPPSIFIFKPVSANKNITPPFRIVTLKRNTSAFYLLVFPFDKSNRLFQVLWLLHSCLVKDTRWGSFTKKKMWVKLLFYYYFCTKLCISINKYFLTFTRNYVCWQSWSGDSAPWWKQVCSPNARTDWRQRKQTQTWSQRGKTRTYRVARLKWYILMLYTVRVSALQGENLTCAILNWKNQLK